MFEKGQQGEEILTYKDLHEKSNKLASYFKEQGIQKGDTVAAFMHNHAEFVYALLAATTLGAVLVPIDPRLRGGSVRADLENGGSAGQMGVHTLQADPASVDRSGGGH